MLRQTLTAHPNRANATIASPEHTPGGAFSVSVLNINAVTQTDALYAAIARQPSWSERAGMAALADTIVIAHAAPGGKTEALAREIGTWGKPAVTLEDLAITLNTGDHHAA